MRHQWILTLVLTGILNAQATSSAAPPPQSPLRGPREGFVFDGPTRSIRAVNGVLGAASLGPALLSPIEYASIAPHSDYGVAFRDAQCLWVSGLDSGPASIAAISGCSSRPEGVAWSADASIAALYSRTENWIQVVTGFPDAPAAASLLSLSPLGASLISVAADRHRVAFGVSGGVYSMTPGESFAPVLSQIQPASLAFSSDGNTLYALDASALQITELKLSDLTSQRYAVPKLQDPVDLRVSPDGLSLDLVGHTDQLLLTIDSSAHQPIATISLSFRPSGFTPLGSDSAILRPRVSGRDPLWTFTSAAQGGVYFVPAITVLREERRDE